MGVITDEGLLGLKNYKYVSGGYSHLDNFLNPFWQFVVNKLFPSWLAPNLVTLIGTCCLVISFTICNIYRTTFEGPAPWWVDLATALCLFLYNTLDACDGKQARKTGSSSPLGQLFDHGCDALATTLITANIAGALQFGATWKTIAYLISVQLPFFICQWEEYHVHIIRTQVGGIFGVTEAAYTLIGLHILSAFVDHTFWTNSHSIGGINIQMNGIMLLISIGLPMIMVSYSLWNVLINNHKKVDVGFAILHLAPMFIVMVTQYWWSVVSDSFLQYPMINVLTIGLVFAYLTNVTVVAAMAKQTVELGQPIVAFPIIGLALSYYLIQSDLVACLAVLGVTSVMYFSFVYEFITTVCEYLGIKCFVIVSKE
eukprot:TRINITY_DN775914_c0_g1_i1.p1 TRINITY_DN775914_c0_g1~~TRINITY_DN775914_c0_g1_i1.p1  ORF type:complete len:370 (-),score=81.70 TRINITY_DN775914_c0_g1_i1:57-1166(-)